MSQCSIKYVCLRYVSPSSHLPSSDVLKYASLQLNPWGEVRKLHTFLSGCYVPGTVGLDVWKDQRIKQRAPR